MRNIPPGNKIKDPTTRKVFEAMREVVEILAGQRGILRDRALTAADLLDLGIVAVENNVLYDPNAKRLPSPLSQVASVYTNILDNAGDQVFTNEGERVQILV